MTEEYINYLKSDHWRNLRCEAITRWGDRCSNCSIPKVDIHHLRYGNLYDVTTEDLMPLCRRCHDLVHESDRLWSLIQSNQPSSTKRTLILGFLAGRDEAITVRVQFQSRAQIEQEISALQKQRNKEQSDRDKGQREQRELNAPAGSIVLTKKLIKACATDRKGYVKGTIYALGLTYPLHHKWMRHLVGKTISREAYSRALRARNDAILSH